LYLIEDIYSRKAVGWEVYEEESGEKAAALLHELYEQARKKSPERWSGQTRNWKPVGTVLLNPDREQHVEKKAA
jgi:hypothetical protein